MKIWKLNHYKFEKLFNKLKGSIMVDSSKLGIDPMYHTKEERKEILRKAFNPDMPFFIDYHTKRGVVRFVRK